MFVNLKSLNESLDKKYTKQLNEVFGDMPDWLSKRIVDVKSMDYNERDKAHKVGSKPVTTPHTTYAGRGYQYAGDRYEKSLYKQLIDKGINLDTVKIIEADMPTKSSDPRLKEPNIPFFLFKNGQVYGRGLNDQEEYREFKDKSGYNSPRAFRYLNDKYLRNEAIAFAYIDGNDDSNFKAGEKRQKRTAMKNEIQNAAYTRHKDLAGKRGYDGYTRRNYDKSGYKVIPSAEKYKDKLNELKAGKIYKELEEVHDYLVEVKDELAYYYSTLDLDDPDYKKNYEVFDDLNNLFDRLLRYYKNVLEDIDRNFEWYKPETDEERRKILGEIVGSTNYDYMKEYASDLKKRSGKVFNSVIDWI